MRFHITPSSTENIPQARLLLAELGITLSAAQYAPDENTLRVAQGIGGHSIEGWEIHLDVGGTPTDKRVVLEGLENALHACRMEGTIHNAVVQPGTTASVYRGMKCPHCEEGAYQPYDYADSGSRAIVVVSWHCRLPGTRKKNPACSAPNPCSTFEPRRRPKVSD